jgi:hypothetical protein
MIANAEQKSGTGHACTRRNGTNRCETCIKRGNPCSWSHISVLFGLEWNRQVEYMVANDPQNKRLRPTTTRTNRLAEIETAFYFQPETVAATTAVQISDPLLQTVPGRIPSSIERDIELDEEFDNTN